MNPVQQIKFVKKKRKDFTNVVAGGSPYAVSNSVLFGRGIQSAQERSNN